MSTSWKSYKISGGLSKLFSVTSNLDLILGLNRWAVTDGGLHVVPGKGPWTKRVSGSFYSAAYWDGKNLYRREKQTTYNGVTTNNESEYRALIWTADMLAHFEYKKTHKMQKGEMGDLHIFMDSKLVVEQVNGHWRIKADNLRPFYTEAIGLKMSLRFKLQWVPREVVIEILGH